MTMPLLTVKDVAARLQVKEQTVYAWASQGKIPCLKVNGVIRFEARDIEQWLETCRSRTRTRYPLPKHRPKDPQHVKGTLDLVIERAKRAVYTPRHGETRPIASPNGKEGANGAR